MRVAFVLGVFVDHTQIRTRRLVGPVAVFTGFDRGNKTIAFERRWNRSRERVCYNFGELPDPRRFGSDPAGSSGHHVTLDALYSGMRCVPIGRELRLHGMAGRSAELWRLHVLDCSIGELGSNQEVKQCGGAEKPSYTPQCVFAIKFGLGHALKEIASAKIDTDRDDDQSGKKDCRNNEENYNPKVRIRNVSANTLR